MQDFHNLQIWKRSHDLTKNIYTITKSFPKEELFGLTSQIRRAVSSIPTNIAEGCGRGSNADFARFLQIAIGSNTEVEYELLLSYELGYLSYDDYYTLNQETTEIRKMIISLMSNLKVK
ncbi:MAG: four helix bundle protein [Alistipes sp.]